VQNVVFCGEVVVFCVVNVVWWMHVFGVGKKRQVFEFILGPDESGSRIRANAHLSDDKTVAKMGHPVVAGRRSTSHPLLRKGWGTR